MDTKFTERLNELIEEKEEAENRIITNRKIGEAVRVGGMGIGERKIGKLRNGKIKTPEPAEIFALATYFGVSVEYLCGVSDIRTANPEIRQIAKKTGLSEGLVSSLILPKEETDDDLLTLKKEDMSLFSTEENLMHLTKLFSVYRGEMDDICEEFRETVELVLNDIENEPDMKEVYLTGLYHNITERKDGMRNLIFKFEHCFQNEVHNMIQREFQIVKRLEFHDLRHTAATIAIASGADIKSVQDLMGHSTASFTLNVYAHTSDKMKADTAARMQSYYDHLKEG